MVTQPVDDAGAEETSTWFGRLRTDHVVRFGKFGVVGGLGVGVNWGFFELGYWLSMPLGEDSAYLLGVLLGLFVSIFVNFVLNDIWTWADRVKGGIGHWFHRLGKYYVSALLAGAIQVGVAWWSKNYFWSLFALQVDRFRLPVLDVAFPAFDLGPRLGLLSGIACGMVVNFLAGHLWAFRDADES